MKECTNITSLEAILNKILENPITFYEKVEEELTPDERLFILSNLENKSCITCTNGSCEVPSYEKTGLDEYDNPQGSECFGWYNSHLIGKSKVLSITDINTLTK